MINEYFSLLESVCYRLVAAFPSRRGNTKSEPIEVGAWLMKLVAITPVPMQKSIQICVSEMARKMQRRETRSALKLEKNGVVLSG